MTCEAYEERAAIIEFDGGLARKEAEALAGKECTGCRHDIPGDCAARRVGEDGYLHFPEGECFDNVGGKAAR